MFIYIVGFCPASRDGSQTSGMAGFDWFKGSKAAREKMREHLAKDIEFDSDYVIRRVRLPNDLVTAGVVSEQVTAWLDANIDLWNTHEQEG